ncbi:hypothetical protein GLOIN_2v1476024 [Rhizophagus clarus]|uniref:Uncharacterized protein n=1 Tax=Rhizophagus clarus TaxID=94130 RepID=A0A8H3LR78_9GLOM|nr:hypothetical protein GLOIN_2v1476024 [Rhizophagus clarus]
MPAKLTIICYVHNSIEHLTQEFTVKEIIDIVRTDDDDLTKIIYIYLKIKAFIPSDRSIESKIEDFELIKSSW